MSVLGGVFLFVLGAAVALAWCYRDQIRVLLGLQKSGQLDAGLQVADGVSRLLKQTGLIH